MGRGGGFSTEFRNPMENLRIHKFWVEGARGVHVREALELGTPSGSTPGEAGDGIIFRYCFPKSWSYFGRYCCVVKKQNI